MIAETETLPEDVAVLKETIKEHKVYGRTGHSIKLMALTPTHSGFTLPSFSIFPLLFTTSLSFAELE